MIHDGVEGKPGIGGKKIRHLHLGRQRPPQVVEKFLVVFPVLGFYIGKPRFERLDLGFESLFIVAFANDGEYTQLLPTQGVQEIVQILSRNDHSFTGSFPFIGDGDPVHATGFPIGVTGRQDVLGEQRGDAFTCQPLVPGNVEALEHRVVKEGLDFALPEMGIAHASTSRVVSRMICCKPSKSSFPSTEKERFPASKVSSG